MSDPAQAQPPKQYVIAGFIALCLLLVGFMFVGCVSIKTHERAKIESYEQGGIDMVERCVRTIESSVTQEELLFELKGILDLKKKPD